MRTQQEVLFRVSVYSFKHGDTITVFESRTERIPYLFWTPDGKRLSFLADEPHGLDLMLAELKKGAPARLITSGAPLYYDWGPSSDRLLIHTMTNDDERTERIVLLRVGHGSQEVLRVLSRGLTPFKTPCWSPDGKNLAYVSQGHLVIADAEGKVSKPMVTLPAGLNSFVWSPDSANIAYSTATTFGPDPVFDGIRMLDTRSRKSKVLTDEPVQAYFFSPDARYIAYVSTPLDLPFYVWNLLDLKSGNRRKLDAFLATDADALAFRYFDQLARSHSIWSPDSRAFVYSGVRISSEHPPRAGIVAAPQAWLVSIAGGEPRAIGPSTFAVFAPAAQN